MRQPMAMLGGFSPVQFMREYWQRRPLLIRQAIPGVVAPLHRAALFELAGCADVESRLVRRVGAQWSVREGPLPRRSLPTIATPNWTLLVQGLDLHVDAAHELLSRFRFVPDARLDDLMMSWASDGGGVGPHLDSYDVFLLQVQGQRRWRIARGDDDAFVEGLPLRILQRFEPEEEWLLEPGDMLYLPPRWAHDGVAVGECMTCSIGFRAPASGSLANELMSRLGEDALDLDTTLYRDAAQAATSHPGEIPARLQRHAQRAVMRALRRPGAIARALGETLTEPKPQVWFEATHSRDVAQGVRLAKASRMMYDSRFCFINGESFAASGRDEMLMHMLADTRRLEAETCRLLSPAARRTVQQWLESGWLESIK